MRQRLAIGDRIVGMIGGRPIVLGLVLSALAFSAVSVSRPAPADAATPTDVMFLFDTSGSMEEVLGEASAEMQQVMTHIESVVPEVDYGVAEVRDYGGSWYDEEDEFDEPWRLVTPVTSDRATVSAAISDLFADGGGDGPEAYGRALWETDTNPTVGWRPGARHAIILIADNVPHMPNVDLGISEAFWLEPSPWETGEELPGAWGIPDTQLPPGQKAEFLEVLPRLVGDGKPLEMVDYHETDSPNYVHYWEYWAGLAGGLALEAGAGSKELANKLIGLIERAAPPCASAVTPTTPSPQSPGALPTALTPRFGGPGTKVTIVPAAGFRFCPGQHPYLGGVAVTSLEESTPSQMAFQVPPNAAGGLAISATNGSVSPPSTFEVDDFRFPWGLAMINSPGNGEKGTYDADIDVTEQDLDSVFTALGPPGSTEYKAADRYAHELLSPDGGLCYGFSVISQALYGDHHGKHYQLGWASWKGDGLSPTTIPYTLHEKSSGTHPVTHALLRAAISQFSTQAEHAWRKSPNAKSLQSNLEAAFRVGQPATLLLHWKNAVGRREGHAVMAFNYQVPDPTTGEGLAVDVVDPNVPWKAGSPSNEYETLQVHVRNDGRWTFTGSFAHGKFGDPVAGHPGSLEVMAVPVTPGGLSLVPLSSSSGDVVIRPEGDARVSAISYTAAPGHRIPGDVEPENVYDDAASSGLAIPSEHPTITATLKTKGGAGTGAMYIGPGFIDTSQVPGGSGVVSVAPASGAIGAPAVPPGTTLSETSVTGEVQHRATVDFSGRVRRPRVRVGPDGAVTVTAAGGAGKATLKLATFSSSDESHSPPRTVKIKGRTKLTRHTPKVKHRKPHKHAKACKGGAGTKRHHCRKK